VEAGLICIFIELCILNEAKVLSYIQDILRHDFFFSRKKIFWRSNMSFMGYF